MKMDKQALDSPSTQKEPYDETVSVCLLLLTSKRPTENRKKEKVELDVSKLAN